MNNLNEIAKKLVAFPKGIMAADESTETSAKRLPAFGIDPTPEMRQQMYDLYFSTDRIEKFLSGVILFEETLMQRSPEGIPFPEMLRQKGIEVGIKVDQSTYDNNGERLTKGLESLDERLKDYLKYGASFTKWRAVITIGNNLPTLDNVIKNAEDLAEYAKICQENGLVPIPEPEVLLDGNHTIEQAAEVTEQVLTTTITKCTERNVDLSTMIVKSSMVLPGKNSGQKATPKEVAEATVKVLQNSVPKVIPGIVFLSGGQEADEATANLRAIAKLGPHPWEVTYSFLRAFQDPARSAWAGKDENKDKAQRVFFEVLKKNSEARIGK
ncbi:MAG: class I fructose-bisphosphate aldolase [bacterium]